MYDILFSVPHLTGLKDWFLGLCPSLLASSGVLGELLDTGPCSATTSRDLHQQQSRVITGALLLARRISHISGFEV